MSKTDHYFHFPSHFVPKVSVIFFDMFLCIISYVFCEEIRSIPLGNGKHFFAFCRFKNILLFWCPLNRQHFFYLFLTQNTNFNFIFILLNTFDQLFHREQKQILSMKIQITERFDCYGFPIGRKRKYVSMFFLQ